MKVAGLSFARFLVSYRVLLSLSVACVCIGCGNTDSQTDESSLAIGKDAAASIIKTYAPLVRLDDGEYYFPSSVPWYVARSDLMKRGTGAAGQPNYATGQLIDVKSAGVVEKAKGSYSASDLQSYTFGAQYYLSGTNERDRGGEPIQGSYYNTESYANFVELPEGAVIQYFFFYPFNGPFQPGQLVSVPVVNVISGWFGSIAGEVTKVANVGEHIGDWEHIDVYVKKTLTGYETQIGVVVPVYTYTLGDIYFARHSPDKDGGFESPGQYELAYGTHPVVYSSKFGHSSHPHHSDFHEDRDKTSNKGAEWRTWEKVSDMGLLSNPMPGNEWLKFAGRWGATENSPFGPAFQDSYRSQAFQPFPPESQKPWAELKVQSKANANGRESELFRTPDSFPTYIRKLTWHIDGVTNVTFSVFKENGEKLFDITADKQVTQLYRGKMYIGSSLFMGQHQDATYTVSVRGINDL